MQISACLQAVQDAQKCLLSSATQCGVYGPAKAECFLLGCCAVTHIIRTGWLWAFWSVLFLMWLQIVNEEVAYKKVLEF